MKFNLSEKIVDVLQMYRHKDIAEFIRLLKEEISDPKEPLLVSFFKETIDRLAGEKFQ